MRVYRKKAEEDALEFIRKHSTAISKTATREYKNLLKQFIRFRESTWSVIDTLKDYENIVSQAEAM